MSIPNTMPIQPDIMRIAKHAISKKHDLIIISGPRNCGKRKLSHILHTAIIMILKSVSSTYISVNNLYNNKTKMQYRNYVTNIEYMVRQRENIRQFLKHGIVIVYGSFSESCTKTRLISDTRATNPLLIHMNSRIIKIM